MDASQHSSKIIPTTGTNKGAYAHPLFIEGRPDLVEQIKRISDLELVEDAGGESEEHPR
jgi:hypothetical protein